MSGPYQLTPADQTALANAIAEAISNESLTPLTTFANQYSALATESNGVLYSGTFGNGLSSARAAPQIANQLKLFFDANQAQTRLETSNNSTLIQRVN